MATSPFSPGKAFSQSITDKFWPASETTCAYIPGYRSFSWTKSWNKAEPSYTQVLTKREPSYSHKSKRSSPSSRFALAEGSESTLDSPSIDSVPRVLFVEEDNAEILVNEVASEEIVVEKSETEEIEFVIEETVQEKVEEAESTPSISSQPR